jgi:hypothetical protein
MDQVGLDRPIMRVDECTFRAAGVAAEPLACHSLDSPSCSNAGRATLGGRESIAGRGEPVDHD